MPADLPLPVPTSPASPPDPLEATQGFDQLPLAPAVLENLHQLGYQRMTPIQAAGLPISLAGHDLIAQAKTGSGKTAVFALALLARLDTRRFEVQALVLCPTRELAEQVSREIRRLARAEDNIKVLTLVGGSTMRPQIDSLAHGAHVVVGTPGRILDHLQRATLDLTALDSLVLDEADRMLDMGFQDAIAQVIKQCPKRRQTLLFSATFADAIDAMARQYLRQPRVVKLPEQHAGDKIRQRFYLVDKAQRLDAVVRLLQHYRPISTLAFCNTRQQCRELLKVLRGQGFHALALHGELEQRERDQVLIQFSNRACSVLVATDVAARGLDIAQLEEVINVDVTPDPEGYIHRIGRTGRADQDGWALSLASENQKRRVAAVAEASGTQVTWHALDELSVSSTRPPPPPMTTLQILGGRKDKLRPADVLGALTGEAGFNARKIGKITVTELHTYVAVAREIASAAQQRLAAGRIKGKTVKVRLLSTDGEDERPASRANASLRRRPKP